MVDWYSPQRAITDELVNSLRAFEPDFEAQKELAAQWKVGEELSEKQSLAIMNNLSFKDEKGNEYKGSLVVDSIVFATETIIIQEELSNGKTYNLMDGPEIKINLKDGYTTEDNLLIELGLVYLTKYPYRLV